ncbi:DUF1450 domain-containing protein [Peribacillus cavernae]|nr:DUF1450 domain-containing protein [Peribacillus cavernae]MDQ0221258.1 uncharacterized protein YuzB (UPF0349 family) [Peribacillus cavernae]
MSKKIIYCFRNKIKDYEIDIKNVAEKCEENVDILPSYCMKLCFLCPNQFIAVVEGDLIVENSEEEFLKKIEASIS